MNAETTLAAVMGGITVCAGIAYILMALMGITHRATFKERAVSEYAPRFIIGVNVVAGVALIAMGVYFFYEYDVIGALAG